MSTKWTYILQGLLTLVQLGNMISSSVPDKWKPVVLGVVALLQIIQARLAHNYNQDGTPSTTAYVKAALLIFALLCASSVMAQTPDITTMLNVKTTAMNLHIAGANNPGTDISGGYTFLTRGKTQFLATTDNLLVPGNNFQGYYGGLEVAWAPDRLFKKTTLPQNSFQLYGGLSGGIARNVPATGTSTTKPSFYTHAGLNYDPTHTGKFSINIIDGGFVYAPNLGYPNPASNGWTLSVGVKLGLWTKTN